MDEPELGNLGIIALAGGMHTMIEGDAGSGKTHVMNSLLRLFPGVLEFGLSSAQAIWHYAQEINNQKIIYIPELQKAVADRSGRVNGIIEFIKSIGEGRDARRIVTSRNRDGIKEYTVHAGITLACTIAHENDFKYDREVARRFLILETKNTPQHIDIILDDKIRRRMYDNGSHNCESIEQALKDRITGISDEKLIVVNPFLPCFRHILPNTKKIQAYADHYLNLMDAHVRFYAPWRVQGESKGKRFVVANVEDVYHVVNMYHPHFLRTLQKFSDDDVPSQSKIDWHSWYAQAQVVLGYQLQKIGDDWGKRHVEEWSLRQQRKDTLAVRDAITGELHEIMPLPKYRPITDERRMLPCLE